MGGSHADISRHVRIYIGVFAALALGTVLTVAASRKDFGGHWNVIVALAIAVVKASLVAAIFMHLKWERSAGIWVTLAFCLFFFGFLMWGPLSTTYDMPALTENRTWDVLPTAVHDEEGHTEGTDGH